MSNYTFERLSEQNLHYLVDLYRRCFKQIIDITYLKKKYNTAGFGHSYIGFLAFTENNNEVAGYYGVFPTIASINGIKIVTAQSGDTMTHPKHQGKGLFTQLAKMTYALAVQEGISFVFGFPNANSYPGFVKKLEWKHYGDVNNYILKTNSLPFDKLAKKIPLFNFIYKKYIKARLKDFSVKRDLENSIEKQNPELGYIVHDQKFYDYKTYASFYQIKVNNINCIIKIDGRMWVGDIAFCSQEDFKKTVNALCDLAKKIYCSSVHFSFFNETFYDKVMASMFEATSKNAVGAINLKDEIDVKKFAYQAVDFDTY